MLRKVPRGLDHLRMVAQLSEDARGASEQELTRHKPTLEVLGLALAALYEASTCNRGCRGGAHILEVLAGRSYNLACAAYILSSRGFYDEALNLVRSAGEISNLVSLFTVDSNSIVRWVAADRSTRLREFSPAKVRKALMEKGPEAMYA